MTDTNTTPALLPCPFCGGEAVLTEHPPHEHGPIMKRIMPDFPDHAGSWDASCANCDCGHLRDTEAEAIAAWNRRTPPAIDVGEREAVALDECPVGLFVSPYGSLCLKTEYGDNNGRIDAYIVSSGEMFWGDHPQTVASQRATMVTPVDYDTERATEYARGLADGVKQSEAAIVAWLRDGRDHSSAFYAADAIERGEHKPKCALCDGTGYKDHAGFAMDVCEHGAGK